MRLAMVPATAGVLFFFAAASPAQIVNGDFSDGLTGWLVENPQPSKPSPAHGWQFHAFDGHANLIVSGTETPAEEGHLSQVFPCGEETEGCECRVRFEYRLIHQSGDPTLAVIYVYIDRSLVFETRELAAGLEDWRDREVTVPCGTREIALCLFVDTGLSGWTCSFDNVSAETSTVGVEPAGWGRIKRLFAPGVP